MEAVLFLPSFVRESQTTTEEISTVLTQAIAQEKPGMINPVMNGYLLYARYQNEDNREFCLTFIYYISLPKNAFFRFQGYRIF